MKLGPCFDLHLDACDQAAAMTEQTGVEHVVITPALTSGKHYVVSSAELPEFPAAPRVDPDRRGRCRTCRAPIEFRQGPSGRSIPVQRVRSVYTGDVGPLSKVDLRGGIVGLGGLYVSHFETCPDAGNHSRRPGR